MARVSGGYVQKGADARPKLVAGKLHNILSCPGYNTVLPDYVSLFTLLPRAYIEHTNIMCFVIEDPN